MDLLLSFELDAGTGTWTGVRCIGYYVVIYRNLLFLVTLLDRPVSVGVDTKSRSCVHLKSAIGYLLDENSAVTNMR